MLLAVLGVFVPLLPTTPFLLLAAWCFARSSERLHRWLLAQPTFGPLIRDWEQHHAIRLRVKLTATLLIVVLLSYPLLFLDFAPALKAAAAGSVAAVLLFLWTRPSAPPGPDASGPGSS